MKRLEPSLESALAYTILRQAIRRHGREKRPGLEPRTAITLSLCGLVGWIDLCDKSSRDLDLMRAEFQRYYDRCTPQWMAQVVEGLTTNCIDTLRINLITDRREGAA